MAKKDKLLRLLGLPVILTLDYMMQVGPNDAQTNFCGWMQLAFPVSGTCLHGHVGLLWWLSGAVLVGSVAWFFWPDPHSLVQDRGNPLALPSMSVTEIAEYLAYRSLWGWQTRLRLTLVNFVRDHVPHEMRDAGRSNKVRYIGAPPNSDTVSEISRAYWQHATFDKDRIWDARTRFFTSLLQTGHPSRDGGFSYQHGAAPASDVTEAWPRASMFYRAYVFVRLNFRKWRTGFPEPSLAASSHEDDWDDLGDNLSLAPKWVPLRDAIAAFADPALLDDEKRLAGEAETLNSKVRASQDELDGIMAKYRQRPLENGSEDQKRLTELQTRLKVDSILFDRTQASHSAAETKSRHDVWKQLCAGTLIAKGFREPHAAGQLPVDIATTEWRVLQIHGTLRAVVRRPHGDAMYTEVEVSKP